ENAVSADRARTAFIKEILSGSVGTPVPAEHGLSPTTPYRALVAEPMRDVDHQVLRRQLESSGQAGAHPALTCVVDERIIGLTPRVPHAAGTGIVSLGPPVEAARAAASM